MCASKEAYVNNDQERNQKKKKKKRKEKEVKTNFTKLRPVYVPRIVAYASSTSFAISNSVTIMIW